MHDVAAAKTQKIRPLGRSNSREKYHVTYKTCIDKISHHPNRLTRLSKLVVTLTASRSIKTQLVNTSALEKLDKRTICFLIALCLYT
jgi:hypothetical protein